MSSNGHSLMLCNGWVSAEHWTVRLLHENNENYNIMKILRAMTKEM